jgi:hypothetical protein
MRGYVPQRQRLPFHPHRDRCVIRRSIRLKQRDGRQRLARLTVATLDDVAAIPRVADCVDHRARRSLNRNNRLTDGSLSRGLARRGVASVDQNGCTRSNIQFRSQPFVPCMPSTSRKTHSSGVFAWRSSTSTSAPLMVKCMRNSRHPALEAWRDVLTRSW